MKNPILIALAFVIILTTSCQELDNFTMFELDYTSSVTIPSSSGLNLPIALFSPDVTTNSETEFAIHDTRKDLLEEVKLTVLTLNITSPSSQRFDFLESVNIFLQADGLSEIKVAYAENIPENIGAELELTVAENDLKEYIKKDKFSLRVETTTKKIIDQDIEIDVFSRFDVDAMLIPQ